MMFILIFIKTYLVSEFFEGMGFSYLLFPQILNFILFYWTKHHLDGLKSANSEDKRDNVFIPYV